MSATLYIVVFFMCVISMLVAYFQFSLSSAESDAQKRLAEVQTKADERLKEAKTSLEGEKIKQEAQIEARKIKEESARKTAEEALTAREAKIKAAEAAVQKKLKAATDSVKAANALKNTAAAAKRDADKKKKEADAAMAKAIKSGKDVDKKLAAEKKKLAAAADKKVKAANKKAADAKKKARAEAKKALAYKTKLNKANKTIKKLSDIQGQYIYIVQPKKKTYINLSEVTVYTTGNKKIKIPGKNVTAISIWDGNWKEKNLVDGTIKGFHSGRGYGDEKDWVRINLGKTYPITKIEIRNRVDCCRGRINGMEVYIQDSKKRTVKRLPNLKGSAFRNTIDPNGSLGWVQT